MVGWGLRAFSRVVGAFDTGPGRSSATVRHWSSAVAAAAGLLTVTECSRPPPPTWPFSTSAAVTSTAPPSLCASTAPGAPPDDTCSRDRAPPSCVRKGNVTPDTIAAPPEGARVDASDEDDIEVTVTPPTVEAEEELGRFLRAPDDKSTLPPLLVVPPVRGEGAASLDGWGAPFAGAG